VAHARRAAGKARRYVRANRLWALWTLTYREAAADRRQVRQDVQALFTGMRSQYGPVPLLAVIERGKRGTKRLHVHMAVGVWVEHALMEHLWGKGWVHVGDGKKCPGRPGAKRLSRYMSKYLSKSGDDELAAAEVRQAGGHRYLCTQGFQPVRISCRYVSAAAALSALIRAYSPAEFIMAWGDRETDPVYGYWCDFPDPVCWPGVPYPL
jgi:hypothetical protein